MGERTARTDADKARSHRNPAPSAPADQAEGQSSEARNPGRANMDRPLEGKDAPNARKSGRKED